MEKLIEKQQLRQIYINIYTYIYTYIYIYNMYKKCQKYGTVFIQWHIIIVNNIRCIEIINKSDTDKSYKLYV